MIDEHHVDTSLAAIQGIVPEGCKPGCKVQILVRPDDILYDNNSPRTACIIARDFHGENYLYTLELAHNCNHWFIHITNMLWGKN